MSAFGRGTLAGKLVKIGLVQLALLTVVFMGVGWLVNGPPPELGGHHDPHDHGPPHSHPPPEHPHSPVSPLDTLFVSGLLILGAGSILTARDIVRPLRHLSGVANRLGDGDLRARSKLDRDDEIGELSRAFDAMAGRIETLVLAEKELLANISHELRTPLARIRVALDIAEESGGASNPGLSEIGVDLAEIDTLIEDIFTATRLDIAEGKSGKAFEVHAEEISAADLARRSADRFRARHAARSFVLELLGADVTVTADPVLFRRALDNLVENADKYSPSGTPITLRVTSDASQAIFEVADRGIGIAENDLPKIFDPFFRSDRSRARGTGGVGLGLTLAKRIVVAHGGSIEVDSKVDEGTRVRVSIPLRRGA